MKKNKIAIYSGSVPSTTFIERLIDGISQKPVEVFLFGKNKGEVKYSSNVKVITTTGTLSSLMLISKYFVLLLFGNPKVLLTVIKEVNQKAINRYKYMDLLVKYLPVAYHKPDVFHLQWAEFIHEWIWVKKIGIRLVLSLRGAHINYSPVINAKLGDIYKEQFPLVDRFHSVCNVIAEKSLVYNAHNITTVYSGLDIDKYPYKEHKALNKTFEIVSVGRWHWIKGYMYALESMKILANRGFDFRYTVVGGDTPADIAYAIHDMGLTDRVVVKPLLPHDEVADVIANADLLLLPSIDEGIANVVLEAMALGTLVLSTDCGGMREVVDDSTGFIVPKRDSAEIADKIEMIAKLSEIERDKIRQAARRKIESQHSNDKMIEGVYNIYSECLRAS